MPKLTKSAFFFIALMVLILLELVSAFANLVQAAPTLTAAPYPASSGQPDKAWVSVNGKQIDCQLVRNPQDGSVTPTCDLASLPVGQYSLVLNVSNQYACQTNPDGSAGECVLGGVASSAPFGYNLKAGAASAPVLSLKP